MAACVVGVTSAGKVGGMITQARVIHCDLGLGLPVGVEGSQKLGLFYGGKS